jgi:V8-like Glu-specific endopeptidase
MPINRSLRWKIASGVGAVGISAGLFAGAASASTPAPHAAAAAAASQLIGAKGQTAGSLVKASPALTAYWSRYARVARNLPAPAPSRALAAKINRPRAPQGPAVKVGGAIGSIRQIHLPPIQLLPIKLPPIRLSQAVLGKTGSAWWGSRSLPPATTTGKVFFTDHTGGNWVCSGSLVNSVAKNVVITAGHCVYGTAGGELPAGETWHSNWVFVPGYNNGSAPYGVWTAKQLWTMSNYVHSGDEQDDIGAAILNKNVNGQNAVSLLGGQGIAWNQNSTQYIYDFGYPAAAPFNGQTLQECDGWAGYNGWWWVNMEMLNCNFTGGSSGGPWLMNFNGKWGYINSVNDANGYFLFGGQMGGLYFGNNAGALYTTVAPI